MSSELSPDAVFSFLARVDNGQLNEAEIVAMKRCCYIGMAKRDAVQAMKTSAKDQRLSVEERKAAVGEAAVRLPHTEATAELLLQLEDQATTGIGLATTLAYWADRDPAQAAAWAEKHPENPNQERLIRPVVQRWVNKDLAAATNWVLSFPLAKRERQA